jgi:hypothetical protein
MITEKQWICRGCAADRDGVPGRIVVTDVSLLKFCEDCAPRVDIAPGVESVAWKKEIPLEEVTGEKPHPPIGT